KVVHRIEKRQENSQSKINQHHPWPVEKFSSDDSEYSFSSKVGKTYLHLDTRSFRSEFLATALQGRAPPVS
ncbi:MAG TPA: hypothetical protein VNA17_04750, partial [Pyrinomonadaceae bacterium]|nr:hypothetical protein [Pyrinomonadaceae bacterium]